MVVCLLQVRPFGPPFNGMKTDRGEITRNDLLAAMRSEKWPASLMPPTAYVQGTTPRSRPSRCPICQLTKFSMFSFKSAVLCSACQRYVCKSCLHGSECLACDNSRPTLLAANATRDEENAVVTFLQTLDIIVPLRPGQELSALMVPSKLSDHSGGSPVVRHWQAPDVLDAEDIPRSFLVTGVRFFQDRLFPPGFMAVLSCWIIPLLGLTGAHRSNFAELGFGYAERDLGFFRVELDDQEQTLYVVVAGVPAFSARFLLPLLVNNARGNDITASHATASHTSINARQATHTSHHAQINHARRATHLQCTHLNPHTHAGCGAFCAGLALGAPQLDRAHAV